MSSSIEVDAVTPLTDNSTRKAASGKPLAGKSVLNTRPAHQAPSFTALLEGYGAHVVELPTLEIRARSNLDTLIAPYLNDPACWAVFTSANAVEALGPLTATLAGRIAAIGKKTADALSRYGASAAYIGQASYADAFIAELLPTLRQDRSASLPGDAAEPRVLLLRGSTAGEGVPRALAAAGFSVEELIVYESTMPEPSEALRRKVCASGIDYLAFTSSKALENLLLLIDDFGLPAGGWWSTVRSLPTVVIGPPTERTARALGFERIYMASSTTIESVAATIAELAPGSAEHG